MTTSMPLTMATPGKEYIVVGLHQGRGARDMVRRLTEMGFKENAHIRIMNSHGRSVVVDLEGTRYALCRGMAKKVFVEEV